MKSTEKIQPIESITGIWRFHREPGHFRHCTSPPGHLLHLITSGYYSLRISGRVYQLKAGDLIYYHESEEFEWLENAETVEYISVGFIAHSLSPPPINMRVFPASEKIKNCFGEIAQISAKNTQSASFHLVANIMQILAFIEEVKEESVEMPLIKNSGIWWQIENRIRAERNFRPSLDDLCEWTGKSASTMTRECKKVTGETPLQRIKIIRMEEAKGLLQYSTLNITQIAEYLGYGRINEFSREFSRYFGKSPSQFMN